MPWSEDCACDREITESKAIELDLSGLKIELRCSKCEGLVGWWDEPSRKIIPIRRTWSEEECLAMH